MIEMFKQELDDEILVWLSSLFGKFIFNIPEDKYRKKYKKEII